jgi:hypothetical protein
MEIDKDDNVTFGQQVRDNCIRDIELATAAQAGGDDGDATKQQRPFFIGCGFHKPHAPYYSPQEFWNALPDYHEIPLPADPWAPVGMPIVAWHPYAGNTTVFFSLFLENVLFYQDRLGTNIGKTHLKRPFCRRRERHGGVTCLQWCEKRHLLRHLYFKTTFLPRQARDKHRKS